MPKACLVVSGGTSLTTLALETAQKGFEDEGTPVQICKWVRAVIAAGMGRCWPLGIVIAHDLRRELCTVTGERKYAGVTA